MAPHKSSCQLANGLTMVKRAFPSTTCRLAPWPVGCNQPHRRFNICIGHSSSHPLVATVAVCQQLKVAQDVETLEPNSKADIIVQYARVPDARHHQNVQALGGTLRRQLEVIQAAHYTVPVSAIRNLANDPEVVHISLNHPVRAAADVAEDAVNANIAFSYGWDGTGIGIAVIDSGISNHPDLKDASGIIRVVYNQDFVGGGTDDHYGHGQHVAGIIGGNGSRSTGPSYLLTFRGFAPNADLVNLRVLDQNGQGTDSTVISAIQQGD